MVTVDVDDSSLQADSQLKSVDDDGCLALCL